MADSWLRIPNIGAVGLAPDLAPLNAPPAAITAAQNIRFDDGKAETFAGHDLATESPGLDEIHHIHTVSSATDHFWCLIGADFVADGKVFAFDGTTHIDITGAALAAQRADIWTSCYLNGNLVINNPADEPQAWDLNVANNLAVIPGWNVNWRFQAMTAFKGFLVGVNFTDAGVNYGQRVKWSSEAAPGSLPASWDALDPTVAAGEKEPADLDSDFRAILPQRDELMLYTGSEVVGMQLVGGTNVWRFRGVSKETGVMTPRSVAAIRGAHVVLSDHDVVLNNGQSVQSLMDGKTRRFLFSQLDSGNYGFAYVVAHRLGKEVWVCFPSAGNNFCDLALVWNASDGTWGTRELPLGNLHATSGLDNTGQGVLTWDNAGALTWDAAVNAWDQRSFNDLGGLLLIPAEDTGATTGSPVYRADRGATFAGADKTCRIERLGLDVGGDQEVTVHEVWPRATGDPFTVRIGSQVEANGSVTWRVNQVFDPQADRKIKCKVRGHYPCIAFESTGDGTWSLEGVNLKYKIGANR